MNDWISVSEAVRLTSKAESTIRRFTNEHKNNKNAIKQIHGKIYINKTFLSDFYAVANDNQKTTEDNNTKHKKEAMQIAYNSEIIKAKDEHIREKDRQIEMLINAQGKKSFAWLYVTIGFVILIIVIGIIGWFYRGELINTYNSKIAGIESNYTKEINNINSSYEKEVTLLNSQLTETKNSYSSLITELKDSHSKMTAIQQQTIKEKEDQISRLQSKLDQLNKENNSDTEST